MTVSFPYTLLHMDIIGSDSLKGASSWFIMHGKQYRRLQTALVYSVFSMKSYQLLHETQLPQTECAMFVLQSADLYRRPSKLCAACVSHRWSTVETRRVDRRRCDK